MSRNDYFTTANLLEYLYQNYYELIGIDLSRQTNASIFLQIIFTEKFEEDGDTTMFFIFRFIIRSRII